ncbi:hypothetical protein G7Y79_00006g018100 [Physcia stellaris]|nr:hypothetical protein G7Y79_00006g018100 [Physcia stellaris]
MSYPVGLEPITASDLQKYTNLDFESEPKTYLEIWCFEDTEEPLIREGPFHDDDLPSWFEQKVCDHFD